MKRLLYLLAATAIVALSSAAGAAPSQPTLQPDRVCTTGQTALLNLAARLQHYAVDISTTAGGPRADSAVLALMDLVESIDRSLPDACRFGG